ncbi:hypothetical protein ABIB99_006546 [Bradyrhizobium sp. LA6.1]|jgi:hypothetical protein|uniref:hypothetical protein n=1 Tax=Bradyrhizobium sp. LA6.1 TaxID=3156378 RepID=UPI003396FB09
MTLIAEHIEGDTRDRSLSVGGATQNVIGMGRTLDFCLVHIVVDSPIPSRSRYAAKLRLRYCCR